MAETENAAQAQVTQRQMLTAGFASVVAWSFDLFDLFILLFVASTIGPLFFLGRPDALAGRDLCLLRRDPSDAASGVRHLRQLR